MTTDARESILTAAFRLFLENGYAGTSLTRILAEVPFSKGALYYHFDSKEALLDAVIERFFTRSVTVPTQPRPTEPLALAHRLVDDYVDAIESIAQVASPQSYYAFLSAVAPRVQPALEAARSHVHTELTLSLESVLPEHLASAAPDLAGDVMALVEGAGLLDVLRQRMPDRAHLHTRVEDVLRAHFAARGVSASLR